ncbi:MAG: hypothetical protein HQL12_04970 [Candidatus Omnitrophica bacterium]|nr:hypothetical protein [Candidatus Omnitrophota bacterium]
MLANRGQSILEYTMIIGIIVVVLSYMGTSIKRGTQSLIKVAADQVGNQQNAEQDFNDTQQGYMVGSNTQTFENNNKQVTETGYMPASGNAVYISNTSFNESAYTVSNTITNAGFVPGSQ